MKNYEIVEKFFRRLARLNHLRAIVSWDEATMMPKGGSEARSGAMAELAVMTVEILRSPELALALRQAREEVAELNDWQRSNLREAEAQHAHAVAVDPTLVELKTKQAILSEQAWRELRAVNNWQDYAPILEKVVSYAREESKQRARATGLSPYDAMLDLYEPGLRAGTVERIFGELRAVLPGLINEVLEAQKRRPVVALGRSIPALRQKAMMREFMEWLGFDFNHGRLDESHHPFCGGVPQDVRLTTRYSEEDYLSGLMGVLHETGHALYEQNLPREWLAQPIGCARGMAVHESQSLFIEMQIGRGPEFAHYAAPILQRYLGEVTDPKHYWEPRNLFHHASRVERGYIRVDADEVTYPAHVILRFEIEKALIEGDLEVKELPGVWNEKMEKYLGLSTLGNDRNGCMQDVHWPSGAFGYFPSYTLGALIAAQLFGHLENKRPNVREEIARGELGPVRDWLKDRVWSQGSRWTGDELIERATGDRLSIQPFIRHIRRRYL